MLNDLAKWKNIAINCSFDSNLTIPANKNMIKTILRNLISNAIKFTHKNGKVDVNAAMGNNQVEIAVSNQWMVIY